KHAEEQRLKLEAQLIQSQKMESVGRLAGGVAHDFNNFLTVILGHAQMGLLRLDSDHPVYSYLMQIHKAGERSADLTQQLLAFARKQPINPKVLDLNETVEGMLKMLRRLIGENINLNWQPGNGLWPIKIDPSQLDQILANLCVNARDAIADVGKITIETRNCVIDEYYCESHQEARSGEYVTLIVCDNGNGMDSLTLSQIFEPFFTTKPEGKGTGLGLATVFGAVKQNNGFINVKSDPGCGTTFTIHLPRHKGDLEQPQLESLAETAPLGHETILVVEDDLHILNLTTLLLSEQGYTVLEANSPAEAIRLAQERCSEINLFITDLIMPEMNGKDLAKILHSINPQFKCIFMSGYSADVITNIGILEGNKNFIKKPFSLKDLSTKVREVLDGS
ncbi:MAG: ATP-binding protein, partial [Deltaproteobacteria bacterium]